MRWTGDGFHPGLFNVGNKIPLWEKIMDQQGTVCCAWEKTAFEEGMKVGIRLMMETMT